MQSYWFGDVGDDRCTPFLGGIEAVIDRVRSIATDMATFVPPDWEQAVGCGSCTGRKDYLEKLRDICIAFSEKAVQDQYSEKDMELLQMVRMLDEIDSVINRLSEKAAEWYLVSHPGFSRKYKRAPPPSLVKRMRVGTLGKVAYEIRNLGDTRAALAKDVSRRAEVVMPNTSALIGGLVAARLMARAGGLRALSRLPSSTIQVLGARTALFSHMRSGSACPKHGIIFQHRRIHNSPREVRGRVSRVLAGRLAIAIRLDYFRGTPEPDFLGEAQQRIDAASKR